MASIDELERRLKDIDSTASPDSRLEGITFEKTYNESLGLKPDNVSDFKVFIPWRSWPAGALPEKTEFPSALQEAFKDVLSKGSDRSSCFIDLHTLNPNLEFFKEPDALSSVAKAIAQVIDNTDESVTPVVRFLAGSDENKTNEQFWHDYGKTFEDVFWPNGEPLVKHKKARLYVAYYSPNLKVGTSPKVIQWMEYMKKTLEVVKLIVSVLKSALSITGFHGLDDITANLNKLDGKTLTDYLTNASLPAISWNHAKIVAINGKTMMTGGGNYWREYIGSAHDIIDHQVKVRGDAAISAHKYADYFWGYLANIPDTDNHSFQKSILLSSQGKLDWSSTEKAPIKQPFKYAVTTKQFPILTVAKAGDWRGSMKQIDYPVQFADAVRDMFLNIMWEAGAKTPDKHLGMLMIQSVKMLYEDDQLAKLFMAKTLGINPAAWATRYARTTAIAHARKSVHIGQQTIVGYLQADNASYRGVINTINTTLSLPEKWNGYTWPFDLLFAIAQALINIKNSNGEGVFLALTTKKAGGNRIGWEDRAPASQIKQRVSVILKGMEKLSDAEVQTLIDEKFRIKRVLEDDGKNYLHTKVVCVDRNMMYVGSDNAYPNYNEEHGIWIEDRPTVDTWFKDFWDELWRRSSEVDTEKF